MKSYAYALIVLMAFLSVSSAQLPESSPEDRALLVGQAENLFKSLVPAVEKASLGTVEVRVWRKRVGYGTVVATGKVLTKWSEVRRDIRSLSCRTSSL